MKSSDKRAFMQFLTDIMGVEAVNALSTEEFSSMYAAYKGVVANGDAPEQGWAVFDTAGNLKKGQEPPDSMIEVLKQIVDQHSDDPGKSATLESVLSFMTGLSASTLNHARRTAIEFSDALRENAGMSDKRVALAICLYDEVHASDSLEQSVWNDVARWLIQEAPCKVSMSEVMREAKARRDALLDRIWGPMQYGLIRRARNVEVDNVVIIDDMDSGGVVDVD